MRGFIERTILTSFLAGIFLILIFFFTNKEVTDCQERVEKKIDKTSLNIVQFRQLGYPVDYKDLELQGLYKQYRDCSK